ncbi:MAG: hypothetical protein Q4G33_06455 [bacterium]|nr:hypothetical protein [bacterium]
MDEYTETAKRVAAVSENPKKDGPAKRVLMSKTVLAHILKDYVREFKGLAVEEIENNCIEKMYSDIPVDRDGLSAEFIRGLSNEDKSNTGKQDITFDILFEATARGKNNEKVNLILNVEPQDKDSECLDYDIVVRAQYYVARLLSRQMGPYFMKSNNQDIRKVYSIWIVISPNKGENTVTEYKLSPEHLYGSYTELSDKNTLSSIIIIRLGRKEGADGALKMLNILMDSMKPAEKLKKLENFGLRMTRELKKEVIDMCDWENAFASRAMKRGLEQGLEQGFEQGANQTKRDFVLKLLKFGRMSVEEIAEMAGFSVEDIKLLQKEIVQ